MITINNDNNGFHEKLIELSEAALRDVSDIFARIDKTGEHNQFKVLSAMRRNKLSETHFTHTTGYGYNDAGRDALERIYADVFCAEDALVRPQIISGTHALTVALFGNLRHGDELLSPVGAPYDTLLGVIGARPAKGSLMDCGVVYKEKPLLDGGAFDYDGIKQSITDKTRMVIIQRSKGYTWRRSLSIGDTKQLIGFIKNIRSDIICLVDNCYCEFVDVAEPCEAGADLAVGSLIKNPGGGLAPVGGYIAGKAEYVENAAIRLTSPGLGKEVGPSLGIVPSMLQGLFLSPSVVASSLKGAVFAACLFEKLGFGVEPAYNDCRADIVQAVKMGSAEKIISFCRGIQKGSPVDSFVTPEPWAMPGYDCPVIMAAGGFVSGASIELSADAPIRKPYIVYMQGGLTWYHAKIGILTAIDNMINDGLIKL